MLAAAFLVATGAASPSIAATIHSTAELAAITERGKFLADYDQASWHATDAVRLKVLPNDPNVRAYVARRIGSNWIVDFGKLNDAGTQFLTAYEATEEADLQHFTVAAFAKPRGDSAARSAAAVGIARAIIAFGKVARPYNTAVLPRPDGTFYVYLYPAQTQAGIYPLGGDERFLFSPDGQTILERRRMHNTILEAPEPQAPSGSKVSAGYHVAVRDNVPEDTDVFHVLARSPSIPEYVLAQDEIYLIRVDGTIEDEGPAKH